MIWTLSLMIYLIMQLPASPNIKLLLVSYYITQVVNPICHRVLKPLIPL
jgi:hypothetical protein